MNNFFKGVSGIVVLPDHKLSFASMKLLPILQLLSVLSTDKLLEKINSVRYFYFFPTYFKVFTGTPNLTHEKTVFSVARLECLKGFPIVDRHQVSGSLRVVYINIVCLLD